MNILHTQSFNVSQSQEILQKFPLTVYDSFNKIIFMDSLIFKPSHKPSKMVGQRSLNLLDVPEKSIPLLKLII